MARRSKSDAVGGAILLLVACGYWAYQWLKEHPIAIAGGGGIIGLGILGQISDLYRFKHRAATLVDKHSGTLTTLRKQLSIRTPYGTIDETRWRREVESFISEFIQPRSGRPYSEGRLRYVRELIDSSTSDYQKTRTYFSMDMDPRAYECMVAETLIDLGWTARLTKGSGDQGVDVIAEMREKKVAIQCKRYQSPIGNSAVQEAYAGRSFEHADFAAVVSNAGFTNGARQISEATRVILLHHDELHRLEEQIFGTEEWKKHRNLAETFAEACELSSKAPHLAGSRLRKKAVRDMVTIIAATVAVAAVIAHLNKPENQSIITAAPQPTATPARASSSKSAALVNNEAHADLSSVAGSDPAALDKILSYCRQEDARGEAACKSNEARAWYRISIKHEFPEGVSAKCNTSPYPDSFSVKEVCMKSEITEYPRHTVGVAIPSDQSAHSPRDNNGSSSQGPSFDCSRSDRETERLICGDSELSALDRELSALYKQAKSAALDKDAFSMESGKALHQRDSECVEKNCLIAWYRGRLATLSTVTSTH